MWIVLLLLSVLCISAAAAVLLTEAAMHPPRLRRAADAAIYVHQIEQSTGSKASQVSIDAADGVVLKGWWLVPPAPTRRAVIVCHGIGDSAAGSLGFAPLFLRNGYGVLVPESRGHGESRGFVTFGIRESEDIVRWLQWVKERPMEEVYGFGESLGGASILQSLALQPDFRAVIAESAYSSFARVADDRVGKVIGPVLASVIVREGMVYALLRYRVNLWRADPADAVRNTHVPIMLIHGLSDDETPSKHSREIAQANPKIELWLVPGAKHTGAYAAMPAEFERRVLAWFEQ